MGFIIIMVSSDSVRATVCDQVRRSKRFLLVNDGHALDGFYMEFQRMPTAEQEGQCVYIDPRSAEPDVINFTWSPNTGEHGHFDAWRVNPSGANAAYNFVPFQIIPLLQDDGKLIGLQVAHSNDHVAYFAIEEFFEEAAVTPTESVCCNHELIAVDF